MRDEWRDPVFEQPEWLDQKWRGGAACRNYPSDLFFPGVGGSVRAGKTVCAFCPVWKDCLRYAVETKQPLGIWGGTTERERRQARAGTMSEPDVARMLRRMAWTAPTCSR